MKNKDLKALKKFTKFMSEYACETHIIIRPGGVYDLKIVAIGSAFRFLDRDENLNDLLENAHKAFNKYKESKANSATYFSKARYYSW